jgi:hypothetical protein
MIRCISQELNYDPLVSQNKDRFDLQNFSTLPVLKNLPVYSKKSDSKKFIYTRPRKQTFGGFFQSNTKKEEPKPSRDIFGVGPQQRKSILNIIIPENHDEDNTQAKERHDLTKCIDFLGNYIHDISHYTNETYHDMARVFIKNNPNYRVATGGGKGITESDQGGYELLQDKGFKDYIDTVYDKLERKMQSYRHLEAQRTSHVSDSNPATPLEPDKSLNPNGKRRSKGKHASCIKLEIDKSPTMVGPGLHTRVTLQAEDLQRGFLREAEIP